MGRARSENGYRISRLNATKHAVFTEGILRSRGPEACPHRHVCDVIKRQDLRSACVPGDDCPVERAFYSAFIEDARSTFSFARGWLAEPDFETNIRELAIVELRRQRLSGLIAMEGSYRPKIHRISGLEYGVEVSLAAGRYATSLDNRFRALMDRLLALPSVAASSAVSD